MTQTPAREPGLPVPRPEMLRAYLRNLSYRKDPEKSNKYNVQLGLALKMFALHRSAEITRGAKTGQKVDLGGVDDGPMKMQPR